MVQNWSLAFIEMRLIRSLASESRSRALVIKRHSKAQPFVLGEPVEQPVQNVVEHLSQDGGESDALQSRGLQKRLQLLTLPDGPVNRSVERKCSYVPICCYAN